jgi:hypothetical protein
MESTEKTHDVWKGLTVWRARQDGHGQHSRAGSDAYKGEEKWFP